MMERILTVMGLSLAMVVPGLAQTHPRLLFGPEDVTPLRQKVQVSPWKEMAATLLSDAESGERRDYEGKATPRHPEGSADPAGEAVNAYRCAFLYVLTGDDGWAKKARWYVARRIDDATPFTKKGPRSYAWANPQIKGLGLYAMGKGVALAYDWCYGAPSWATPVSAANPMPFRNFVSRKLLEQGDTIAVGGGGEQNKSPASNWQANRAGSAMLCYLATDENYSADNYRQMVKKAENYVRENIGPGKESRGWNIEGIGYLGFPWGYIAPAAIAAKRNNPSVDLIAAVPGSAYTLWTQYAASVRFERPESRERPVWILHPDFGDDNASADDANGCYGLAFKYCKPELVPGLKYWYDRLLVPEKNYDYTRAGTIYSILFYPRDTPPVDPLTIPEWRDAFLDRGGNGFFTFRNHYSGPSDMVAQVYLKLRGEKGHNGPDALSFRILGLNTAWAVGGGRYGVKDGGVDLYRRQMNTLYPADPCGKVGSSALAGRLVGTPVIRPDGSGHVIASIDQNNVGVANQKRWFVADYGNAAGVEAVYIVGDTSKNGLYWQLCTLEEKTTTITHQGNTFTISGHDGATLRGTVLLPAGDLRFTQGSRQRGSAFAYGDADCGSRNKYITLQGAGEYVVVLTVAKAGQTHPAVVGGQGGVVGSNIKVGSRSYTLLDTDVTCGGR